MLFPELDNRPTASTQSAAEQPLAYRLSPSSFDDYIGQEHVLGKTSFLRNMITADQLVSIILYGPPGCGKTALARLISKQTKAQFIPLNAVTASVSDIKSAVQKARAYQDHYHQKTILFVDEIHRFNKTQQDALLPDVESGLLTLIGATTENPYFSVIPALLSRTQVIALTALLPDQLRIIAQKALSEPRVQAKSLQISDQAIDFLVSQSHGDARKLLNFIELVVMTSKNNDTVSAEIAEDLCQQHGTKLSTDDHYDLISALIKSIRGSDADAAVYWLARLLKGGEDPVFITRRLIILASEDIGNADPMALILATSLIEAVRNIGMPEVQLNLAQVVTYLALAPKSNSATIAIFKANHLIDQGKILPVPDHLKDSHYKGAQKLGHGIGYKYPHDYPNGYVNQSYLSENLDIYSPKSIGFEKQLKMRKTSLRSVDEF